MRTASILALSMMIATGCGSVREIDPDAGSPDPDASAPGDDGGTESADGGETEPVDGSAGPPCDEGALFGGGDGSAADPWRICAQQHLDNVRTEIDRHFVVLGDIDMSGFNEFQPIGTRDIEFSGQFDGGGFAIRNLTIDADSHVGLFSVIAGTGTIENVIVDNITIKGATRIGAIAGVNSGTIRACGASGEILVQPLDPEDSRQNQRIGGLAGHNLGRITSSNAAVAIRLDGDLAEDSDEESFLEVGGLVGTNGSNIEEDLHIIETSYATGAVEGHFMVGGLVGLNGRSGDIRNSFATGDVTGYEKLGGLVGQNRNTISDAYATGGVELREREGGGLVGDNLDSDDTITNAYASGTVSGDGFFKGGLVGRNHDSAGNLHTENIISSYYDIDTASSDETDRGSPIPTGEFADENTFSGSGWNFQSTWTIGAAPDDQQRPIFQWQQD